jgi:hypothetical protein
MVKETSKEVQTRKMIEACDKDPKMLAELCRDPKAFAAKHDVTLAEEEVQQLKKVGALIQLVGEFTAGRVIGPGPIFYPADVWWKRAIFNHVVSYRGIFNPLFNINILKYPIGYYFELGARQAGEINTLRTRG